MARRGDMGDLATYAVVGGGLYLGYKMALDGQLGADLEKFANDIYKALFGKDYQPLVSSDIPIYYREAWNLWVPYAQQIHRSICDYQTFREYVLGRGLLDPGDTKPDWFCP